MIIHYLISIVTTNGSFSLFVRLYRLSLRIQSCLSLAISNYDLRVLMALIIPFYFVFYRSIIKSVTTERKKCTIIGKLVNTTKIIDWQLQTKATFELESLKYKINRRTTDESDLNDDKCINNCVLCEMCV